MDDKKGFLLYRDYIEHIKLLSNEDNGILFLTILEYVNGKGVRPLSGGVEIAFSFIKSQLDRDEVKYQTKCDKNKENGKKGGRPTEPKESESNPKEPNGYSDNPLKTKKPDTDTDTDTDTDKDKENKKTYCAFFEELWLLYPNKIGKASITDKQKRDLEKIGIDALSRCITRYKDSKPAWKEYQQGSTFFHKGYIDYLDDNYTEVKLQNEAKLVRMGDNSFKLE